jgi:O-succinylbenzoic acid--CoA ligase
VKYYRFNHREYTHDELEQYCWQNLENARSWERHHLLFLLNWLSNAEVFKTFTSGSTGEPKQIELSRKNMTRSAQLTIDYFRLPKGTKALLALPSNYIGGKMMLVRALVGNWHLIWTEPTSNPLLKLNESFDFAAFTPMQVAAMLNECPERFMAIGKVIIGGGAISDALEMRLKQCTNNVYATYGMTETITHVAVRALTGEHAGSTFNALPGVRFSLNDNECLTISAQHLEGVGTVETKDRVKLYTPLSFQFLGRVDNVINSGGVKLFPEKIEEQIAHVVPYSFYISKKADDVLGEKVVLYLETASLNDSEELQIISAMKLYLQPYEVPKEIIYEAQFEYTPNGKIIRKSS